MQEIDTNLHPDLKQLIDKVKEKKGEKSENKRYKVSARP